jgi:GNAT superfamily N-acetyltransferase
MSEVIFREAAAADMPGISRVRTSVVENATTPERLEQRGITNASVAASFLADSKGWVAVQDQQIVGFSIADRASQSIFALFVLPGFERRGSGSRLFDLALRWLWANGAERVWLATGAQTTAAHFYERRGWVSTGTVEYGDVRYEIARPNDR